jgi:hypothetical protein
LLRARFTIGNLQPVICRTYFWSSLAAQETPGEPGGGEAICHALVWFAITETVLVGSGVASVADAVRQKKRAESVSGEDSLFARGKRPE